MNEPSPEHSGKERFRELYQAEAPWDVGRAQPALVELADQVQDRVLDAGCGTGENALFFAERGHEVTGIDFIEPPILRAREKARQRGLKATFLLQNALSLAETSLQFDSVIDCGLFHTLSDEDRNKYVASLAAVVRPGGNVFLMCFSDREPGDEGPRRVSQQELRQAFQTGWDVESIRPSQFATNPKRPDLTFSEGGPRAWLAVIRRC